MWKIQVRRRRDMVVAVVTIAPYGAWASPISATEVATARDDRRWSGVAGGFVWWTESRPEHGGRVTLLRARAGGEPVELLGAPWNVRNRVHEYGGRPWTAIEGTHGQLVAFTHWDDQRVYLLDGRTGGGPVPISPPPQRRHGLRYAELSSGPAGRHVWCVREVVTGDRPADVRRDLVALPITGEAATDPDAVQVLAASHHLLTGPKASPDGRHAAWIGWDHPRMPWDGTELCVAQVQKDGRFGPHRVLAGGPAESVCQVEWDGPQALLALTDPDGWWNLHRIDLGGRCRNLAPCAEELGGPLWMLGMSWFAAVGGGRHAVLRSGRLAVLDEHSATVTDVDVELPQWLPFLAASGDTVVTAAGGPTRETAVIALDLSTSTLTEVSGRSTAPADQRYLPVPHERRFAGHAGHCVPAFVYLPTNPDFAAPDGEHPPFVVHVHGGPTGKFAPTLNLTVAYLTSRGIGVVAVNHGGSSGYGRAFRELLREQWGVVDVHDCAAVARALAAEGVADGDRLAVRGGSAGGWTSAASMVTVDTYRCGTIMYPILDLTPWTGPDGQTHDFESRYLDGLIGALPEHADRYTERSPMHHAGRLAGPVLVLQGLEDTVCPPEQANRFVAGLAGSGVSHAYLTFDGEQHGFRRSESIQAALEAELSFYGQVFGFVPPGVPTLELAR
jgi:dipeptidyl aminopeptidase/acylaminoacyl peptidase